MYIRDILFQPVIVAYAEIKKFDTDIILKNTKKFKSDDEYIYFLTHKVNNIVHKDGRIYM